LKKLRKNKAIYEGQRYYLDLIKAPFKLKNLKDAGTIIRLIIGILVLLLPPGASLVTDWLSPGAATCSSLVIFIFWYIYSIIVYLKEMCDIDSENFHYDAYRKRRKKEFELFSILLDDTFEISDIKKEFEEYDKVKEKPIKDIEKILEAHNLQVRKLDKSIKESESEILFLEKMIQKSIDIIESCIEGGIKQSDLNIFNGYAVYEYKEGFLHLRKAHKPRGSVERKINTNSPNYRTDSCVKILGEEKHYLRFEEGYIFKYAFHGTTNIWVIKLFIDSSNMNMLKQDFVFGKMNVDIIYDVINLIYPYVLPQDKEGHLDESITS
jgi:hypothetical protein